MDTAYYNAYAIHLGYLGASSLPSSLAYPALPRLDLTIEPRQRSPAIWQPDKLVEEACIQEEWEQVLGAYYSRILDDYRKCRKCSDEEKKEFRKAMLAAKQEVNDLRSDKKRVKAGGRDEVVLSLYNDNSQLSKRSVELSGSWSAIEAWYLCVSP
ncbi:hypothetical protein VTO58DRAFT_105991 [Aureobasidium pullulans]